MNAQQLKNAILQEAITGRLVPQAPNDEPASVLLDKIRKEKVKLVKEGKLKKKDLEEKPISKEEIPFEIPESWEWVRIGDIFIHASGKQQSSKNKNTGNLQKYITTSNLYWGRFVLDNLKEMYFTDEELKTCSAQKGDLLVCEGGAGYGRSAIWDKDYNICLQNHVHRLRPVVFGLCEYAYYLIYFLKESNRLLSVGTAMPGLSANRLKELLVPLPPLSEQHRIVAKIEELLPKVEEYGKAQEALDKLNAELPERLKKSILQEAITGKLVPQNPNDEPASVLLDKIRKEKAKLVKEGKLKKKDLIETPISKEEIPFEIPESWEWVKFGAIVKTYTGKTPERGNADYWCNEDYPWVSISDMKQGETIMSTKECISTKAAERCFGNQISPKGSLIMSFKLTVGRTSFLGVNAYHNEAIITIITISDPNLYLRNYLSHVLPIISNWGDTKDAIKGKTLNSKSIYNLLIPLPPYNEQHRIVVKINQLLGEVDRLKL